MTAVLTLGCLAGVQGVRGTVNIEVSVGFENRFRSGFITPVTVTLTRSGPPLRGEVVLEYTGGNTLEKGAVYRVRRGLVISEGVPAVHRFLMPLEVSSYPLSVSVVQGELTAARVSVELRPLITDAPMVAGLSRRPSLGRLTGPLSGDSGRRVELVYPGAEALPEDAAGWDGVSRVVWHDLPPEYVDGAAAEALAGWVAGGGELLMFAGPWFAGREFPEALPIRRVGLPDSEGLYAPEWDAGAAAAAVVVGGVDADVFGYGRGRVVYVRRDVFSRELPAGVSRDFFAGLGGGEVFLDGAGRSPGRGEYAAGLEGDSPGGEAVAGRGGYSSGGEALVGREGYSPEGAPGPEVFSDGASGAPGLSGGSPGQGGYSSEGEALVGRERHSSGGAGGSPGRGVFPDGARGAPGAPGGSPGDKGLVWREGYSSGGGPGPMRPAGAFEGLLRAAADTVGSRAEASAPPMGGAAAVAAVYVLAAGGVLALGRRSRPGRGRGGLVVGLALLSLAAAAAARRISPYRNFEAVRGVEIAVVFDGRIERVLRLLRIVSPSRGVVSVDLPPGGIPLRADGGSLEIEAAPSGFRIHQLELTPWRRVDVLQEQRGGNSGARIPRPGARVSSGRPRFAADASEEFRALAERLAEIAEDEGFSNFALAPESSAGSSPGAAPRSLPQSLSEALSIRRIYFFPEK